MANAREQMKILEVELAQVRAAIERLRIEEAMLSKMIAKISGEPQQPTKSAKRAPVKPVVLDIMRKAGAAGATSMEVDNLVRERVPSVAKDTVGSILSRLKGDGALAYVGERYYEKQFAPKEDASPFESKFKVV